MTSKMIHKKLFKRFLIDLCTSENLLLMFFNIFIFMIIEVIFFWYVLSYQIVYIIENKAELLVLAAQQNPSVKKQVLLYLNNGTESSAAIEDRNLRNSINVQLIFQYLGPFMYVIFSILILIIIYKICGYRLVNKILKNQYDGSKMSASSYFLLMCVICSFITEIIYYFVVINQWNFISDAKLFLLLEN